MRNCVANALNADLQRIGLQIKRMDRIDALRWKQLYMAILESNRMHGSLRTAWPVVLGPKSHAEVELPAERDGRCLERVELKAGFRLASYVVGRREDSGELVLFDHLFTYAR